MKFSIWLESKKLFTSKGSEYVLNGTSTVRTKKSLGLRQGEIHESSTLTVYISPATAELFMTKLQDYAINPTKKAALRIVEGIPCFVVKDRQTGTYVDSECLRLKYSTEPQIGLCPLEFWDKGYDKDDPYKYGFHIGHPIIKIE